MSQKTEDKPAYNLRSRNIKKSPSNKPEISEIVESIVKKTEPLQFPEKKVDEVNEIDEVNDIDEVNEFEDIEEEVILEIPEEIMDDINLAIQDLTYRT